MPILKLFFNPNTLNQILYTQSQFNVDMLKRDATSRIERAPSGTRCTTKCCTTWCSRPPGRASR